MNQSMVKYITLICIFLLIHGALFSQELKSRKVSFKAVTSKQTIGNIPDHTPPQINIISPVNAHGNYFKCQSSEIDLIGELIDESGIKFITVNSDIREISEKGIFSSRIKLNPGMNKLRFVAMDFQNNINEQVLLIDYQPPTISLADRIKNTSTYYGLIIANNEYEDETIQNLNNPIKDAEQVYSVLTSNYTFEELNITFLQNATRADIITSLDLLSEKITPNDNLLIYYAGHGWWDPEAKNGYWLPSDANSNIKTNWFRNSTLVNYVKEIKSKHTLLITDACFGGSIFESRTAFSKKDKAYETLYDLPSRKAMTSGQLTEVPDESSFAKFLVERLSNNDNQFLTADELFIRFKIAVINNSDAVPLYGEIRNVGDEGGDFIFLKREPGNTNK